MHELALEIKETWDFWPLPLAGWDNQYADIQDVTSLCLLQES